MNNEHPEFYLVAFFKGFNNCINDDIGVKGEREREEEIINTPSTEREKDEGEAHKG